jgi:integrase
LLADELAEYLARRNGPGRDALVFTALQGAALRQHHFYWRYFKPAVQRAGLEVQPRFHDLRHTCVALLVAEGAHQLTIMRRLGHSSIQVTLDTYGHQVKRRVAELVGRLSNPRPQVRELIVILESRVVQRVVDVRRVRRSRSKRGWGE